MASKIKVLWAIRLYFVLAIAWMAWGWFAYAGPFRWAAEWQVQQFGSYDEKWTVLLPLMILVLPAVAIGQFLGVADQLFGTRKPAGPTRRWAGSLALLALVPLAVCALAGAWYAAPHAPATVGTLDLVTGQEMPPSTDLVTITGRRQPRFALALTTTRSVDDRTTYVPLTQPNWAPHDPVRYLIESTEGAGEASFDAAQDAVTLDGASLERNGLPGVIRERFRSTLTLAEKIWVIHPGAVTGETTLIIAGIAGLIAAVLLLAAAILAVIEQIRSRAA